ncbi:MAG: CHAT domain-containing protein [Alteromonadaceae bacterium]
MSDNRLLITKVILNLCCSTCLLCCCLATAVELSDWQVGAKVEVAPNTARVFLITENNKDIEVAVLHNDALVGIQNGPGLRLGAEFVVIRAVQKTKTYQILIRATHQSAFPLQWQLNEIPAIAVEANKLQFNQLHEAAKLWQNDNAVNKGDALLMLEAVVDKAIPCTSLYYQSVTMHSRMLLKFERFQVAFDIADSALSCPGISRQRAFKLRWIKADAMLSLDKREVATQLYGGLVNEFTDVKEVTIATSLVQEEIRGNYGLAYILWRFLQGNTGKLEKGRKAIQQAIQKTSQLGDFALQAQLLNNLWSYHALKGDFVQGEKDLLLALQYSQRAGGKAQIVKVFNHLSLNYRFSGQLAKAQIALRRALLLLDGSSHAHTSANFHSNMATIYNLLGDYHSAKRYYMRTLKVYRNGGAKHSEAMAYKGLGVNAREQGKYQQAIGYHKKSLSFFENTAVEHAARLLIELARDYFLAGEHLQAKRAAKQALALPGDIVLATDQIDAQLIFAKIAWHEGDIDTFLNHLEQIDTEHQQDISPEHRLELTSLQIKYYLQLEDASQISEFADKAIGEIEQVRKTLDTSRLGPAWTSKSDKLVSEYIAALMQLAQSTSKQQLQQKVFEILAQNHAINLRERRYLLAHNTQSPADTSDQQLILLWEQSLAAERLVVSAQSEEAKQAARSKADDANEAYLNYAPSAANQSLEADLAYLSLDDIQHKLQTDEMFIRYYVRDNITFAFVVTKDGWEVLDIEDRAELAEQGQALISALKKQQLAPDGAITSLTKLLPLKQMAKANIRRLIIVHDDILNIIPFSALNISANINRYRPLVNDYEVVRTYSAAEYFAARPVNNTPHQYDIAVFADPVFDKQKFLAGEYDTSEADEFRRWANSLSRLPSTAKEAAAIEQIYADAKVKIVTGTAATNEMLMSEEMRSAKILHIASHGYFSESTPDIVGIATSVIDQQNQDSPGFLTLTELLSKPFSSNLIVISGCETLLGKQLNGEGLNGLARGLLSQGAGSVISTLWSIPDKPTAEFMKTFYTYLKQFNGNSVRALNQTKRQFSQRGRYRKPVFWAGFVLTSSNKALAQAVLSGN